MNKFQEGIKFKSIDDFLDYLPQEELRIVEQIRLIVFETIPDIVEKLAYNVPFYYRHKRICFIWPSSIPWGGHKEGVALGFCQGAKLKGAGVLQGGQKVIRQMIIRSEKDINKYLIQDLLIEAYELDKSG